MVYFLNQIYSVYLFNYLSPCVPVCGSLKFERAQKISKTRRLPGENGPSDSAFFCIVFRKLGMSPP